MSYPIGDIELAASAGNNELQNMSGGDDISLTDKEKAIANECYEALIEQQVNAQGMFDLFLSRIREEQGAAAWMYQHEDTGQVGFVEQQQIEWGFEAHNPRLQVIGPLFTTPPAKEGCGACHDGCGGDCRVKAESPPAAQCDCDELVEALERVLKWVAPIAGDNSDRRAAAEEEMSMTCAIAALANHAKRMKGEE